jgi:hypothetical protein
MAKLGPFIRENIRELRQAWRSCGRSSDALYSYLQGVFRFHHQLSTRWDADRAAERIAEIYGFTLRDDMDLIRCITEAAMPKTNRGAKNRIAQALRLARDRGWKPKDFVDKMKDNGGIKGSAEKFADSKTNKYVRYSRAKKKSEPQEDWGD